MYTCAAQIGDHFRAFISQTLQTFTFTPLCLQNPSTLPIFSLAISSSLHREPLNFPPLFQSLYHRGLVQICFWTPSCTTEKHSVNPRLCSESHPCSKKVSLPFSYLSVFLFMFLFIALYVRVGFTGFCRYFSKHSSNF